MRLILGLFVLLFASPASAFEGEIDARSIGATGSGPVTFKIRVSKKGDVRMDTSTKGPDSKTHRGSYITPATGKYNYALDHERKQATKIPKETVEKLMKDAQGGEKGKKANVEIKKLGSEKVAGKSTRHIRIIDKDEGHTADMWLSDQYPSELWHRIFSGSSGGRDGGPGQWSRVVQREYGVKPGFVMKMLSKGKDGQRSGLEVTRLQKKKVSPGAFAIPRGYEVVEMPAMPSGMPSMTAPKTQEEAEKMREEWMKKMEEMQKQQR